MLGESTSSRIQTYTVSPMSNPNFPPNLAIQPSSVVHHCVSQLEREAAFGVSGQQKSIEKYGIAGRVWEAAYLMDLYVRGSRFWEFDPPFSASWQTGSCYTVLELGSGTGIVGFRIADNVGRKGKDLVIVTDLPDVCPLLEANLCHQLKSDPHSDDGIVLVRPLTWGDSEHASHLASELLSLSGSHSRFLTHLVCSDLVYFPELFAPLLRTLIQLSSPPFVSLASTAELVVLVAYKVRSLTKESPFWSAFGLWFSFEPVSMIYRSEDHLPEPGWMTTRSSVKEHTSIFIARRRPASFSWNVPPTDQDLMNGVGAYGTDTKKGDDTFETLLFMNMQEDFL